MSSQRSLVTLSINGIEHEPALEPRRTLLDALRHDLQLTELRWRMLEFCNRMAIKHP
ncbi:MAG: hypothetical protein U0350_18870 [Caldilineaceae bacterium]